MKRKWLVHVACACVILWPAAIGAAAETPNPATGEQTITIHADAEFETVRNEGGAFTLVHKKTVTCGEKTWTIAGEQTGTRNADGSASWEGTRTIVTPKGETRTATTEGTRSVARNDDGTKTVSSEHTIAFDDGKSLTVKHERVVTKNEDGSRSWTGASTATRSDGKTASSSGRGSAHKTENGWEWTRSNSGTAFRGKTWSSETSGSGRKTEDGREWTSRTNGQFEDGGAWTTTREGKLTRDAETNKRRTQIASRKTITRPN